MTSNLHVLGTLTPASTAPGFDPFRYIPPPPTAADVQVIRSPLPPDFGDPASDLGAETFGRPQAELLANAYRGLAYHKGLRPLLPGPDRFPRVLETWKLWPLLEGAWSVMKAHEIAPHAWVEFAFRTYNHPRSEKTATIAVEGVLPPTEVPLVSTVKFPERMPPVATVFKAETIEKRRGWFHKDRDQVCRIKVIVPDALTELRFRYGQMERDIEQCPASGRTIEFYQALRNKHFPDRTYSGLIAQAKGQASLAAALMTADLQSGKWVWE